jgi:predicted PurR-regulated permease PerM
MADPPRDSAGVAAARRAFYVLGTITLVVISLSWGRYVFVTFAVAVLLTLLLGPVVAYLERRGLRRTPAVLSTAFLAFLLISLLAWAVAIQVASLLEDLPQHKTDMREKLSRSKGGTGPLAKFRELLEEVDKGDPAVTPVVRVEPAKPSTFEQIRPIVGPALGVVSAVVAVVLLVITLLLYREDTRNRLIRLAGRGRLTVTTRALNEAARRIGGYLLGHSTVNAGFGTAVGLGLFFLGVPYPVLWGLLAGLFRFVPSVGVWLVAPLPAALAYIGGTAQPLLVLALFLVLELATANLVEPRVCGRSVGLAPVPLFVAIIFWTGVWGIVGLVLATPVTVCLAVLGKYVPALRFLAILLGREAALRPAPRYYQRLLARDRHEAEAVLKEYLTDHSVGALFDRVLIPALTLVRRGKKAGELKREDEAFILGATREIVAALAPASTAEPDVAATVVLGIAATDGVDEAALDMLRHLTREGGPGVEIADRGARLAAGIHETAPAAVLIAAVGPGGLTEAGYLCRRLRSQQRGLTIVVGRWGRGKDPKKARDLLISAGADRVVATLREARAYLARLGHSSSSTPEAAAHVS